MDTCFYCEKDERLDRLMIKITELSWSAVYLNRNQNHKGRCIVAFREHRAEYFQLSPEEQAGFFAEVCLVAKALTNVFKPGKINYATFGDLVPHAHFHIVPKYPEGLHWGKFFEDEPKLFLSDDEYGERIRQIKAELDRLGGRQSLS
jgi:diadenosine tetraphosphate (Ap4A) HIT family hydrolase